MNHPTRRSAAAQLGALICLFGAGLAASAAKGEPVMIEDFSGSPATRWEFITDQVMGGVSSGRVSLETAGGQTVLRLQGTVSTQNNGGFIQARLKLSDPLPKTAQGLELRVKGNGQTYFIHARTGGTVLPWNFYQAPFPTTSDWQVVRIPFGDFKAQGQMLRANLESDAIRSLAVVAYGRDHSADVLVASIGFY